MQDIELDKGVSENLNVLKAEHVKLSGEVNNVVTSIGKAIPIAIIDPKWKLGHSKGALLAAQVLLGISMLLTACGPQSTAEISPSSTAPAAAETAGVADGIESPPTPIETESPLPQEIKDKFDKAGIDLTNMANAKYDKDGLHITLKSGEVLLTNEELEKRIHNGQDNVLQYRDKTNKNVIYAFDKETKTFLEASKYIQKDKTNFEEYIKVNSWDELKTVWAKEKMFLIPFDPENTYFPESDQISRDYLTLDRNNERSFYTPFGELPTGMDSPFKFVNFTILEKDEAAGRLTDTYLVSEQVYNPDDKSFSILHFVVPDFHDTKGEILEVMTDDRFLLPQIKNDRDNAFKVITNYYSENNLIGTDDSITGIEELVSDWFDDRHVPSKLDNIPLMYRRKYISL